MATVERTVRPDSRYPSVAVAIGTILLSASLWLFGGGVTGVIAGFAVGFATAASASYYGVGLAHLTALLITPSPGIAGVVLLELASVAYLSSELASETRARDGVLLVAFTGVALALVTVVASASDAPTAAATLVAVTGVVGYAVYRYGLWKLGVLAEGPS